jgi:hypothetical protein
MRIVERIKAICLKPKEEWQVIAAERTSTADLLKNYALPLAGVGAVAAFIGNSLVGFSSIALGTVRVPAGSALVASVLAVGLWLAIVYVAALLIEAFAPRFGAEKNHAQAVKVAVYAATPGWVGGVLAILPPLAPLGLLAHIYGLYLLYLGLQQVMKTPADRALPYTAAIAGCWLVMVIVASRVIGNVAGIG